MALVPNTEPHKYGGVLVDDAGAVTGFTKKGSSSPSYHYIGVQVTDAEAFASVPDNTPYESVGALYPTLMAERPGSVRAFIADAEFLDIGTPADYLDTCVRVAARDGHALTDGSVLWDHVVVEPGARLTRCIVTDGVRVPPGEWTDVTLRLATGELEPFEQRIGELAVAPLRRAAHA
jgi:NDP-sugar pyrophosphorylase family protein